MVSCYDALSRLILLFRRVLSSSLSDGRYNGRDSKGSRNLKDHPKKMNNPDSIIVKKSENLPWASLVVQLLRLCASIAEGTGLIPGWGTKILNDTWRGQK